ncbi:hypothetical protein JCM12298_28810 [Desulfothermus naphthae]
MYLDPTNVYVGFTAATGAAYEAHDIIWWEFTTEPPAAVPLPGAIYLLGSSLLAQVCQNNRIFIKNLVDFVVQNVIICWNY